MSPLQFLAVGDVTTDTFIRLTDAKVACDEKGEACTITLPWSAKIPYEFAVDVSAVGNAPNAAISAARLGLKTGLLSVTGTDALGDQNVTTLKENAVDTELVIRSAVVPSNHDYVLWYGPDRTIIRKYSTLPYRIPVETEPPPYVYLSSLGDETGALHAELLAWLSKYPSTRLVFQPGRELALPKEKSAPLYAAAYLCILNKEEAEGVLGLPPDQDIKTLLAGMQRFGPSIAVVTNGPDGAYAFDGTRMLKVPMYLDPRPAYERTGAGDAFASTVAAALALGKSLDEALLWAPINAMAKVQKIGGHEGLLRRDALEKYLVDAPPEYKLETLT
ncbi:MAG: carbohydrate kinase family protein [Minisyncoccia bacterium]